MSASALFSNLIDFNGFTQKLDYRLDYSYNDVANVDPKQQDGVMKEAHTRAPGSGVSQSWWLVAL